MAITSTQRTDILKATVAMFGASAGGYLSELTDIFTANGSDMTKFMTALSGTTAFTNLYPSYLTKEETAAKMAAAYGLTDTTTAGSAGKQAYDYFLSGLTAGTNKGAMFATANTFLATTTDTAFLTTKTLLNNKTAVAEYYSVTLASTSKDLSVLTASVSTVTATTDVSTDAAKATVIAGTAAATTGQTFSLTAGLDNIAGTAGNDTIIGSIDAGNAALNIMSSIDVINGGAGIDTFKLSAATALTTANLANISNVEVISIDAASTVGTTTAFDTTAIAGVTTLNVTRATDAFVKAAATTAINVTGATGTVEVYNGKDVSVTNATTNKAITVGGTTTTNPAGTITVTDTDNSNAANDITITGGTDVTVTATSRAATGDIIIGHATNGTATGNVVVTQNINDVGAAGIDNSLLPITVTGGKTVNVTVNGTSTADAAADTGVIKLSAVTVVGDTKTTDVTVTQTGTTNVFTAAKVAQVDAKSVVTFVAMATGESTTVNGLTFTAAKALTAAQVASSFSNLTLADKQTASGLTANGYFTGTSSTSTWTSGAASGATVTFTNATAANLSAALAVSDTAVAGNAAAVTTAGTGATGGAFSIASVAYGTVNVKDNAAEAIKTVTLNGFASAKIGIDAASADSRLDALTTLNLANNTPGGAVTVATNATKLALGVNNITSTTAAINLDHTGLNADAITVKTAATVADLTINATGKASTFTLTAGAVKDLTINADVALNISTDAATNYATTNLKTVDVNGAGAVNLGVLTAAALNNFDASGNTGGVTATIDTATASVGTITEYIFSGGNDVVTLDEITVNTKINLGAGDDKINLKATTTALANTIDGGTGTNTIHMNSADANKATGATNSTAFETKISNFQKLSLAQVLTTAKDTVDLANMDDISYVISAGTADTTETTVLTTVSTTAETTTSGSISLVVGGRTYTVNNAEVVNGVTVGTTAAALTALAYKIAQDARVASAAATVANNATITITSNTGNVLQVGTLTSTLNATTPITATNVATGSLLTLENMANNGTLELTGTGTGTVVTMTDATGLADTFNILTGDNAGNVGTVIVKGVETVKVTTTNTFVDVTGGLNGNGGNIANGIDDTASSATLRVTSDKTTTVDVSGAGDLTLYTASSVLTTVNASTMTGALTYTAFVNSVVVTGGTAADSLAAKANDVKLIGGAGNDTLTVNVGADRAVLDGGAGADKFVIDGASSTSSTYANILNVNTGDTIQFTGATSFAATKVTLSVGATETTQALMDLAVNNLGLNQMGWFQTGGNTFIVMDAGTDGSTGFVAASDMVVMITGLVDLSTASFNVAGTIEIA